MSIMIDQKYTSLLSNKLERFTYNGNYVWNFRCPLCGDSKKNTYKSRGYIYRKKSNLSYMCHNCGTSMSFGNFLKSFNPTLYREYQMDRYKEENRGNIKPPDEFKELHKKPVFVDHYISLPTIESLPDTHSAKQYLSKRKIPSKYWTKLYYADDFLKFCDTIFPHHGKNLIKEDPRIVIPFYDKKGELQGFQGRALRQDSPIRYITIKAYDESIKIFGLDRLDEEKTVYVTEGPFDSMFLNNAIATMDAALYNVRHTLGELDYVFVYDNEPRNKDIIKHMTKTIKLGHKICIWPSSIQQKDINDLVLAGVDVQNTIELNTFSTLKAELQFQAWRKM